MSASGSLERLRGDSRVIGAAARFPLRIVGDVGGKVAHLMDAFECVWATSWEYRAPKVFTFGAAWPVIGFYRTAAA